MKEVAETRTNRSEIIPVSITRKSRTAALAWKEEVAHYQDGQRNHLKDPPPPSPECDEESKSVCRQER